MTPCCFIQKNYKDSNLRNVAREKLAARKAAGAEAPKYRDRASERRTLFNQPDTPVPEKDTSRGAKRKVAETSSHSTPPPAPPGNDNNNVGNKLLKMMGWKEGTGLGSEGEGRLNPVYVIPMPYFIPSYDIACQGDSCFHTRSWFRR